MTNTLLSWPSMGAPPTLASASLLTGRQRDLLVICAQLVMTHRGSQGLERPKHRTIDHQAALSLLQVHILSLPDVKTLRTEKLEGEVIPRSVLLAVFEDIPYLLCALGDGHLLNWQLDAVSGELRDKKIICLGTKPIMLRSFRCAAWKHHVAW